MTLQWGTLPHGLGGEAISRIIASHEPEAAHPCRYRGRAAGRFGAVASAGVSALIRSSRRMYSRV